MRKVVIVVFILSLFSSVAVGAEKKIVYSLYLQGNKSLPAYSELTDYIAEKLKANYRPIFEPDYAKAVNIIAFKDADFGFLCSGPFVIGKERYGIEAIAAIKPSFNMSYRGYIIVPAGSNVRSLLDLKGKSFAFVDLQSYTGRLVPIYMIKKIGENPLKFFSSVIYTKSHEASLNAVAEGKVDGAAVISLLFEHVVRHDPTILKRVRVIDKSDKTGFPVFVTIKHIPKEEKKVIQDVLINMHKDKKGKKILQKLEIDYFFVPNDSDYDMIKTQLREIKEFVP